MNANRFLAGPGDALLFRGDNLIGVVKQQPCTLSDQCVLWVNCFETLKPYTLQHDHETRVNVIVAKAEKSYMDGVWLNPKH